MSRFVHGTRADAEQALLKLRLELFDGASTSGRDTTLTELLAAWLNWASPRLSPSTRREYDRIVRVHLVPSLGRLPLRRLRPVDVDRMMDDLRKGGLAPRSIRGIHAVLRRALNQAVKWEWIERNPAALASPPAVWSPEIRPPSLLAVIDLIGEVREHNPDVADFFQVAAMTGMRRGEIAGLCWADVDVERRALTVRHSVVHAGPGEVVVTAPKTHAVRHIALDDDTVALLTERRTRCAERAEACGASLGPWVWGDDPTHSRPLPPDRITDAWRAAAARHGLAGVRFHDLRHMHVTELLAAGLPVRSVAQRAGHATPTMTLNVYGHSTAALDRAAADILARAARGE